VLGSVGHGCCSALFIAVASCLADWNIDMTNEDIIGMAVEAGFADAQGTVHAAYQLEAFANLVAAHKPEQNLSCKSTQARLAASWGYVKAQPEQYSDIVSDGGLDPRNKPEQETSLPSLKDLKRSIRHRAKTEGYPCHFCGKHFCNHGCLKD
jgi:hypothetical protein